MKKQNTASQLMRSLTHIVGYLVLGIIIVAALIAGVTWWANKDNGLTLDVDQTINITPEQIRSIEAIGQWEFLSVSDEELIDTVRHGFFGDDQLVRIYYGTLRLGIDLHEAAPGWIRQDGDTVRVTLPPVGLLDNDFIDEARTRSFFESGKWNARDRQAMYDRAYKAMKRRCLSEDNLQTAEDNAKEQFSHLIESMGFKAVSIQVERQ